MLYYLSYLTDWISYLRIFRYITFRALLGAATAFLISVWLGPWLIRRLRAWRVGQIIRQDDVPDLHKLHGKKAGTPTMGGLLILGSVTGSMLLWSHLANTFVWLTLGTFLFMGLVGLADDYAKLRYRSARGIRARTKFLLETAWALFIVFMLLHLPATRDVAHRLMMPFFKNPLIPDMGIGLTTLFLVGVLVGASNAVNLTDGLDGLAIGCSSSAALSYLVMAYVSGHMIFANYLHVPYVAGSGELAIFCGCLLGGGLGFLWFNCHPAQVFMGDTGSLALGAPLPWWPFWLSRNWSWSLWAGYLSWRRRA